METIPNSTGKPKVAFLCFSALPYAESWGGSQRVHYMANAFSSSFDVTVFAPKSTNIKRNDEVKRLYETLFFDDNISKKLFDVNKASERTKISQFKNKRFSAKKIIRNIAIGTVKTINSLFFNEPTYFKGIVSTLWIKKYEKEICKIIKERKISVLIISIPPWNIISLSLIKKIKDTGCKIIVDYRDPWNCWNEKKGLPFIKEKKISHSADMIFVTNENHAEKLVSDLHLDKNKINVIMNGYDEDKWNEIQPISPEVTDMLEVAFIGSIQFGKQNTFRDPSTFVDALDAFEHKDSIRFRVIGCKDEAVIESMRNRIPHFEMVDSVSQSESFHWMMKSHVLVNFHTTTDNSSKYLIAGKIFDYYRSGAKILSINGVESYERYFVEHNHAGYYSPNDVTQILNTLGNIYRDWAKDRKSFHRHSSVNRIYSRQYQNDVAKKIVFNLLNK